MHKFNVRLNGKTIDTVFATEAGTIAEKCEAVRSSLIGHDGYADGIKVTWPKGQRVTSDSYDLEGNCGQGWELLCSGSTMREARAHKRDYLENAPCPLRIVKRREKIGQ